MAIGAGAAVVSWIGGSLAANAVLSAIVIGVIDGAIIGAAIGGLTAAVTGGDIGKGILFGAVGGAVTGGISGYFGSVSSQAVSAGSAEAGTSTANVGALSGQTTVTTEAGTTLSATLGDTSALGAESSKIAIQNAGTQVVKEGTKEAAEKSLLSKAAEKGAGEFAGALVKAGGEYLSATEGAAASAESMEDQLDLQKTIADDQLELGYAQLALGQSEIDTARDQWREQWDYQVARDERAAKGLSGLKLQDVESASALTAPVDEQLEARREAYASRREEADAQVA